MPETTCGLLMFPALTLAVGIPMFAWRVWSWWALLLPIPVFFVSLLATHYIPWTLEYLSVCWRRCPRCGRRNWSYPFTSGFGL